MASKNECDLTIELSREGAFTNTSGVSLDDTDDCFDELGRDAETCADTANRSVRRCHERVRAEVHVKQARIRAFHENSKKIFVGCVRAFAAYFLPEVMALFIRTVVSTIMPFASILSLSSLNSLSSASVPATTTP